MAGAFAAVLGFTLVLWLTRPIERPPGVAILENANVSDPSSLMAAVQTAGLRGTANVRGAIEEIRRLDNERVTIRGWAADTGTSDSSLSVIVFASGTHVLTTALNGPSMNMASIFRPFDKGVANNAFEGTFACRPDGRLIVVVVTPDRTYSQFRSLVCP
jgi:hypothetical protein